MDLAIKLIVLLPLLAAAIAGLFCRIIGDRPAQIVTCAALLIAAALSIFVFIKIGFGPENAKLFVVKLFTWIDSGTLDIAWSLRVDTLTAVMLIVVTGVSSMVHVYSIGYMAEDPGIPRFMSYLSLFTFFMLMLVTSDNLVQLFFGWEGVGLASYLLIGFWYDKPSANAAAIKAFIVNRVGDFGFALGIFAVWMLSGSVNFAEIFAKAPEIAQMRIHFLGMDLPALETACLLLFVGAMGKSAQLGLHTWLPDAMEGPTPVSALIHAATMVVAGVYLGARLYPVFYEGFSIGAGGVNFMALIGGVTIIIGALLAFVQRDIKKVLAYSTISQLGYMVMGLGVGAWVAALFHLFTHAFFKALLFLGAGSVSHSGAHHSFDMKSDMGGLRKYMPITFWTFIIGSLALSGIFPLAGFWSKDEILVNAGNNGFDAFLVVGLVGAVLTAAYMTRCVYLTFFGEYRGHGEPHESGPAITVPLVVLAAFSAAAGIVNAAPLGLEKFTEWVEPKFVFPTLVHAEFDYGKAVISVTIAVIGIGIAGFLWFQREELGPFKGFTQRSRLAHAGYTFLENKYYLDYLYEDVIVRTIREPVARAAYWFNQQVIDGVVNGVGRGAASTARVVYDVVDQEVVDGSINLLARETGTAGGELRKVQSGRVQRYALLLFAGVGLLSLALLITNTS